MDKTIIIPEGDEELDYETAQPTHTVESCSPHSCGQSIHVHRGATSISLKELREDWGQDDINEYYHEYGGPVG